MNRGRGRGIIPTGDSRLADPTRPPIAGPLDLIGYLHQGWAPLIRPAPATRPWMDATAEKFAYRCLPLDIANAHGWEVLNPHGAEVVWDGGAATSAVTIRQDAGGVPGRAPVSIFGNGVLTFHIEAIFRTPPGWNLMVGGSPNRMKDAIAPLGGVIETDWSPYSFTMNWRFTRTHTPVRFEAMEPICFFFPVERAAIEAFAPRLAPLTDDPATAERFAAWSAARAGFHAKMKTDPGVKPSDRWQKHYYRGVDLAGDTLIDDHKAKLRLKDFDRSATPAVEKPPADDAALPAAPPPPTGGELAAARLALARREWLLETMEAQRALVPPALVIERRSELTDEEFLERYYAVGRPVILTGEMALWPALRLWSPAYLQALSKEPSRLLDDIGPLTSVLDPAGGARGALSLGRAGALIPLHHLPVNSLIAQVAGRQKIKLAPAAEAGKLYEQPGGRSAVADLEAADLDLATHPLVSQLRTFGVTLAPGEMLFVPVAWWRQARALEFSAALTFTSFRWRNDAGRTFPPG